MERSRGSEKYQFLSWETATPIWLVGEKLPLPDGTNYDKTRSVVSESLPLYGKLSKEILIIMKVRKGQDKELIAICPYLSGWELNGVFHLGASSKNFGYDQDDIKQDWVDLYDPDYPDPDMQERKKQHEEIPNWEYFSKDRKRVYDLIVNRVGPRVLPVIRIKIDNNGGLTWNYNNLEEDLFEVLSKQVTHLRKIKSDMLPSLGSIYASVFSPDINQVMWSRRDTTPSKHGENNMGATQAWAYALWKGDALFNGKFIKALVSNFA